MKKNIIKFDQILFSKFLILISFMVFNDVNAQVKNNGTIYIGQTGSFYVNSGNFEFGLGSIMRTRRPVISTEKLILGGLSTFVGANSNLFVDGVVGTRSNSYIELPIGSGSSYAPIGILNSSVTNGVWAEFISSNNNNYDISTSISVIKPNGGWLVSGDSAFLTLIWNTSVSSLVNSITDLTVAGLKLSTNKWEIIPSSAPTGSIVSGNISTSAAVNLSDYLFFTLAKRGVSCAPLVSSSGITRTWNGSSWDVVPTLEDSALLTGSYPSTAGSFVCNSLNVGANNVTLVDGQTIEVVNEIVGTGSIIMSSEASVMQRNDSSVITPTIVLTKRTRANMRANDYIYWGSPLNADAFGQLDGARVFSDNNVIQNNQPAFDSKYKYVSGDTSSNGGWKPLTSTEKGKGFIMRIKQRDNGPYTTTSSYSGHINLTFTGNTNNGNVTVATANLNATSATSSRNNNLLANPYPSAIDADKFLEFNTNLDGVVYLWKATTPDNGSAYNVADYVAYTRAGSTGYSGIGSDPFNGKISTGQGFKVKALDSSPTGTVFFNNCMRVSGNNNQFMRTNNNVSSNTIDRFKVNISDVNGIGNQILIAYMPEASLNYDRMYDASLNTVSSLQIYSILDNDIKKLAINARPTFENTDQVTVGFTKVAADNMQMSLNIVEKEGIFASNQTPIYLYDNLLNVYHNFATGAYTFTTIDQENNTRFKIVYQNALLGNDSFDSNLTIATLNDNELKVASKDTIEEVKVFDITGRLVLNIIPDNKSNSFSSDFYQALGIYVVKVKLSNGQIVTSKLTNKD